MTGQRLPLELVARILRLAAPPRTLSSLGEHTRPFKRLSLVHRSWTRLAQRELRRHVCLDFAEGGGTCSASEVIRSADFRAGIERLDISTGLYEDMRFYTSTILALGSSPILVELGFWRSREKLQRNTCRELGWYFERTRSAPSPVPPFHSVGPSLRYLCIDHHTLEGWELEHFPALQVLLFTNTRTGLRVESILDTPSSDLRILGFKAPTYLRSNHFPRLPPKLTHLAIIDTSIRFSAEFYFQQADLRECSNLRTFTLGICPSSDLQLPRLHEQCIATDVTADTSICGDLGPLEAFDLEEWALRVGA
ncbi:hypothetical protein NBRC10512_003059 [Rhodotorula toruloides]|uniref:RHTO0S05e11298g1_1 n=2 Tax=Rhodotorula toruloides TaxID=5286 RepID=A0A061B0C2_RHOTO|nr:uncharacterized protein RHTO_06711 [Rhodotorula toruloides NP11]EMS23652.1 hypothetical protein RHTO_06711 [Rhodotorula toruloides NP11]CDR41056.1 RHTO0S05e11298g1_1 [Rhodotorula toruloides]